MAASRLWHLCAILGLAMALHSEEDFAFEMTAVEEQELLSNGSVTHPHPSLASSPIQRLWGIPDTVAPLGKLFHMNVPRDAFSGDVDHYEVSSQTF
jgi:neurexin